VSHLKTRVVERKLADLTFLKNAPNHKNARFMAADQFQRLVENIKGDGCLTSTPLIAHDEAQPDIDIVVSGNHRVEAAIAAGIEAAHCIEIIEPLSRQRLIAIQLSHNAIEGDDDKSVLKELYDELDIEWREYSGLSDNDFDLNDLSVASVSGVSAEYIDLVFSFLSEDAQAVQDFMDRAQAWARRETTAYAARFEQFEDFLEAIIRAKALKGVNNSSVAVALLCELAGERMDQIEAAQAEAEGDAGE
jgi:hypothetical protein